MQLLQSNSALYSHKWWFILLGFVSEWISGLHVEYKTMTLNLLPGALNWKTTERWILPLIPGFLKTEEVPLYQIHQTLDILKVSWSYLKLINHIAIIIDIVLFPRAICTRSPKSHGVKTAIYEWGVGMEAAPFSLLKASEPLNWFWS